MVNLLHLCETMTTTYMEESDLGIPLNAFVKFAERNHFTVEVRKRGPKVKYKLVRREIPVFYISGAEETEFKFFDLADVHIGHANFDEDSLRKRLDFAKECGVERVFIAGDLFEGCCNSCEAKYLDQLNQAFSIFKDYPFIYYAINGNHEYSFEQAGFPNPLRQLGLMLEGQGIDFKYFDAYLMDFIVCGVVKRLMHVEKQDFNKRRIFPVLKLKSFEKDNMLQNTYEGNSYPVRFFLVGHIHVNVQMFYSRRKIYISQAGSFIHNEPLEDRGNVIQGSVVDQKVFMS